MKKPHDQIALPPPDYCRGNFRQWSLPGAFAAFFSGAFGINSSPSLSTGGPTDGAVNLFPHIRWQGRGESKEEAHFGSVLGLSSDEKLQLLEDCPETILFDWKNFAHSDHTDPRWSEFSHCSLPLLPELSIFSDRIIIRRWGPPLKWWQMSLLDVGDAPPWPHCLGEALQPNYQDWVKDFSLAQKAITHGPLQKVVMARKKTLSFSNVLNHACLWERFRPLSSAVYRIMIRPKRNVCFYSLSPERLFKKVGQKCWSEAIAGSVMPSGGESSAASLQKLLGNSKELCEHQVVIAGMMRDIQGLSHFIERGKTQVLDLGHIRHLKTPLLVGLKKDVSPTLIRDALHPTPALGGWPKSEAQKFLHQHGFSRGLYGAPIGRWSQGEQEYAVGIRSVLCRGSELEVFAGAGIVAESQARSEWQEMANKMGGFSP